MKIKEIHIKHFKRFTDLSITNLPETAKLIVLVGPNGSGKTSLFEAFNHWYGLKCFSSIGDKVYRLKKEKGIDYNNGDWYTNVSSVNLVFWGYPPLDRSHLIGSFYFRTAYRNEPDFTIYDFSRQDNPLNQNKENLMSTDITVSSNFQRLVSSTISSIFSGVNDDKIVSVLREEIIGKIRNSLNRVFGDLILTGLGDDPLNNGSFFFTKGSVSDFHYKNLSAGEKSAFDLILDLIVKSHYFPEAVYCIDEPEAHMHTHLQAKVLNELYSLVPVNSQLWISTHSLGMLRMAQKLEYDNPGTVVFLDFDGHNFDEKTIINPSVINRTILQRFMMLALDDFSEFIAPQVVVFCEGNPNGYSSPSFDSRVYSRIFSEFHPDTAFVSAGSCSEVCNQENAIIKSISHLIEGSKILRVIDRDDLSGEEVSELLTKGIRTLSRRNIESFLLDDEVLSKLCNLYGKIEDISLCIEAKKKALADSIGRGNPADDLKSASGQIMVEIKKILSLTRCGNSKDNFFINTIAPLITPDTKVYAELEQSIFG